jgi:hypothetical protein
MAKSTRHVAKSVPRRRRGRLGPLRRPSRHHRHHRQTKGHLLAPYTANSTMLADFGVEPCCEKVGVQLSGAPARFWWSQDLASAHGALEYLARFSRPRRRFRKGQPKVNLATRANCPTATKPKNHTPWAVGGPEYGFEPRERALDVRMRLTEDRVGSTSTSLVGGARCVGARIQDIAPPARSCRCVSRLRCRRRSTGWNDGH